jgi:hypothetical protein
VDWITRQIAIGNFVDASAAGVAEDVDAVLCLREGCPCELRDDVDALYLPLKDGPGNTKDDVRRALQFINVVVDAGDRILVHRVAGRRQVWFIGEP